MRRVRDSKYPTFTQLTNMALNLQQRFNSSSKLSIECNTFEHNPGIHYTFWIHAGSGYNTCWYLKSWEETKEKYNELMGMELPNGK